MKPSHAVRIKLFYFLALFMAFRLLSLIPEVIDVDEAWFAASGAALQTPFEFYNKALDNKLPGTVWIYWALQRLFDTGSDPRPARLACDVFILCAAYIVGRTTTTLAATMTNLPHNKMTSEGHLSLEGWIAMLIMFVASALPTPEMLAPTSEAFMLPAVCFIINIALHSLIQNQKISTASTVSCALSFVWCLLMKQTAVFFIPVIAYGLYALRKKNLLSRWHMTLFVVLIFLSLTIILVIIGPQETFHWAFLYPYQVLWHIRQDQFSSGKTLILRTMLFFGILWPLSLSLFHKTLRSLPKDARNIIHLWSFAAVAAVILGKGIFFHYFIHFMPILAIAFALTFLNVKHDFFKKFSLPWLAFSYFAVCTTTVFPQVSFLWGTDLNYYRRAGKVIEALTQPNQKIFIWGGNALALIMAKRQYATRFVTSRFAAPPYGTGETARTFKQDFNQDLPALIVDLHKRGDERLNLSMNQIPWLQKTLDTEYRKYTFSELPWAIFYKRNDLSQNNENICAKIQHSCNSFFEFDQVYSDLHAAIFHRYSKDNGPNVPKILYDMYTHYKVVWSYFRLLSTWENLKALNESYETKNVPKNYFRSYTKTQIALLDIEGINEEIELSNAIDQWMNQEFNTKKIKKRSLLDSISVWGGWALVIFQPKIIPVTNADLF